MSCFSQTVTDISATASHFCVNMHQAASDWTVGDPSKTKESVWQGTAQSKSPNVILRSFVGTAAAGVKYFYRANYHWQCCGNMKFGRV